MSAECVCVYVVRIISSHQQIPTIIDREYRQSLVLTSRIWFDDHFNQVCGPVLIVDRKNGCRAASMPETRYIDSIISILNQAHEMHFIPLMQFLYLKQRPEMARNAISRPKKSYRKASSVIGIEIKGLDHEIEITYIV